MAVRNEAVRLTLIDDFTAPMTKVAVTTAAARKALRDLDKTNVTTARSSDKLAKSTDRVATATPRAGAAVRTMGNDLGRTEKKIDSVSGRMGLLAEAAIVLGPALVPLGAVAVPGIAALATGLGAAVGAAGAAALAFRGFGDALKAVNAAKLEPTAENLAAVREEMAKLDPAARKAVQALAGMRPMLDGLTATSAQNFFPGFVSMLEDVEAAAPRFEAVIAALSGAAGGLMEDAGNALDSGALDEFFSYIETDGKDAVVSMGRALGSLGAGFADLIVSTRELSGMGLGWLEDATSGFAEWSAALDETDGYQEFVEYIRENGPQLGETLASIGNAFLQIIEAAAPLGGPTLMLLEAFADTISAIADSDLGTPIMAGVSALLLLNRALAVTTKVMGGAGAAGGMFSGFAAARTGVQGFAGDLRTLRRETVAIGPATLKAAKAAESMKSRAAGIGKTAAGVAGLGLAVSGVADGFGLANTAMLGLVGASFGPVGAGIGAAAGFAMDLAGGFGESAKEAELTAAAAERARVAAEGFAGTMSDGKFGRESRTYLYDTFDGVDRVIAKTGGSLKAFADGMEGGQTAAQAMAAQLGLTAADMEQLNEMSTSGDFVDPAAFEAYAASIDMTGDELRGMLAELKGVDQGQKSAAESAAAAAKEQREFEASLSATERAQRRLVAALDVLDQKLSGIEGIMAYEAALDALQATMGSTDWDLGTAKGRENAEPLVQFARDAEAEFTRLMKTGKRVKAQEFLSRAIADLNAFAEKTPAASGLVKGLKGQLSDVERQYLASIGITGDLVAIAKAHGVKAALDIATRDRNAYINVITRQVGNAGMGKGAYKPWETSADGGTVPSTGLPYADRHHYLLADGEEVISNRYGQADRNRALLKAINANRLADGGTVGLANGGTVFGRGLPPVTAAALSMTPLVGPINALRAAVKVQTQVTKQLSKATERAADKQATIGAQMSTLATNVGGKFDSQLFGVERTPFMGAKTDPLALLQQDTAGLRQQRELQKLAKSQGMSKEAFDVFASQASIPEMRALLGQEGWAKQYQTSFDRRANLQRQVGGEAGQLAYGPQYREARRDAREARREERQQTRHLKGIEAKLSKIEKAQKKAPKATGRAVAAGSNGAARKGVRNVVKR